MPASPGVYLFLDENSEVIYVGKAKDLKKRIASYFAKNSSLLGKTKLMVSKIANIRVVCVESELESLLLEANFIKKYSPLYNVRLNDGKNYPLIRITRRDVCPKVLIARRPEDKHSIYFGPYPNTGAMKMVLKIIRRIFPFESTPNHPKRKCLYYHLNLCPCIEAFNNEEARLEYKRNIKHIIQFLSGETKKVLRELEKERDEKSKNEEFEKAKIIQQQIDAVKLVTSSFRSPFEYEINPNFKSDLRDQEMMELKEYLEKAGVKVSALSRIECFDVSNIQGHFATASMVVFINGEKEPSLYRRFRINYNRHSGKRSASRISNNKDSGQARMTPNDYAMMSEVISRRIKHTEWDYPNLIIVDGGKGQVSSTLKVLQKERVALPIIGLAKKEERIILVKKASFGEIRLPRSSKALQLIQRIRDEAHRFAITYHRKLRSKNFLRF